MKNLSLCSTAIFIASLSLDIKAMDADSTPIATTPQRLVLALNTKDLARYLIRTDTYTAQYGNYKNTETSSTTIKVDAVSKKLKKASKAFKRLTSIRGKNGQKIRAKIGKSSLILKYSRPL